MILGLPAAAVAFGGGVWPFELAHHFVVHLAVLAALAFGYYTVFARRALALAAGALAVAFASNATIPPFAPTGGPFSAAAAAPRHRAHGGASISLVSFNILANQEEPDALLDWLAREPADVMVLLEATPAWLARFSALGAAYPYRISAQPGPGLETEFERDIAGASGIAILSRLPLGGARIFFPAGPVKPAVTVTVRKGGESFTLVAVHPMSPMTITGLAARDEYFASLADALAEETGPLVVAGDFNATPFTPSIRRFVDRLELDSPRGSPATYPALAGPFGLAIDRVLVRGVSVRRLDALPARGSDHRGLLAGLVLPVKPGRGHEMTPRSSLSTKNPK